MEWKVRDNHPFSLLMPINFIAAALLMVAVAAALTQTGCTRSGSPAASPSPLADAARSVALPLADVQRQLAALPCPPGVPPELWAELTGKLDSQLTRRASASPLIAGPPLDELSRVNDLRASEPTLGQLRLRWSYKNTGDYDQNSESNISDLTPIGLHFGKNPAAADWLRASVADGDLNREVNISDITPIGRCYLQTVTEYRVEYNATGEPGSEFEPFEYTEFAAGERNANGWRMFEEKYSIAPSGYYRVVPYYHSQRGIEGLPVYFGADQPPHAVLNADVQIGESPLRVQFDASESYDPEHTTLTFTWDWEGDGVIDFGSGTNPLAQYEYTDLGDYAPVVHVRDARGATDTDALMVYCHEWERHDVTEVGQSPYGLGIVNGKPAFLYSIYPGPPPSRASEWWYARSEVPVPSSGEEWVTMRVVQPEELPSGELWGPSGSPRIFELAGQPAFHYFHVDRNYLAHAKTAEPSSMEDWELNEVVNEDSPDGAVWDSVVVNDRVYAVNTPGGPEANACVFRSLSSDPQSPIDWDITSITKIGHSPPGPIGYGPSCELEYIAGHLSVSFIQLEEMDLHYAYCTSLTPAGPLSWREMTVDTAGDALFHNEMIGMCGYPVIVSLKDHIAGPGELRLARGKVKVPTQSSDWKVSTVPMDYLQIGMLGLKNIGSVCGITIWVEKSVGEIEWLALYPSRPGIEGLDAPWVSERIDAVATDTPGLHAGEKAEDWLILATQIAEFGQNMNCVQVRTKAHYKPW